MVWLPFVWRFVFIGNFTVRTWKILLVKHNCQVNPAVSSLLGTSRADHRHCQAVPPPQPALCVPQVPGLVLPEYAGAEGVSWQLWGRSHGPAALPKVPGAEGEGLGGRDAAETVWHWQELQLEGARVMMSCHQEIFSIIFAQSLAIHTSWVIHDIAIV